jgi:serine/threonine protein kinase
LTDDWDIKLCDFGLSTTKHTENIYCGTADYACPEVLAKTPYSPMLADTWSYGVTVYAMLMATLPWDGWRGSEKALVFISLCLQKERPYLCLISDHPWLKYDEVKSYMSKIEIH